MAPAGETQTMTAVAREGYHAKKELLAQGLALQQQLLQGEEYPTTAAERRMHQDRLMTRAGGQRFRLAWAR